MASRLTPCTSCTRHVKVGSAACPFCGGEVPASAAGRAMPSSRPLTRAAILFASAAAVTACSSSTTSSGGEKDAAVEPDGHAVAAYGAFVDAGHVRDATDDLGQGNVLYGVFTDAEPGVPDGQPVAAYGAFPHPDAGDK